MREDQMLNTDARSTPEVPAQSTRRTMLRGAGVAGAAVAGAGILAACGSDTPAANQPAAGGADTPVGTTTPGGASTGASTPAATTPAAGGDIAAADVPVGGGVIVKAKSAVVTQPAAGEFKAFDFTCTHQGCAVTSVTDGKIVCPCHDSHFDITTGDPTSGPASKPLAAKTVAVNGDQLTIT